MMSVRFQSKMILYLSDDLELNTVSSTGCTFILSGDHVITGTSSSLLHHSSKMVIYLFTVMIPSC